MGVSPGTNLATQLNALTMEQIQIGAAAVSADWLPVVDQVTLPRNPFDPDALTAATWDYPLGSRLKIVYGNKSVLVEVTDKGGARAFMQFGKVVDLSHAAFARLEKPAVGSLRVKIIRVE